MYAYQVHITTNEHGHQVDQYQQVHRNTTKKCNTAVPPGSASDVITIVRHYAQ